MTNQNLFIHLPNKQRNKKQMKTLTAIKIELVKESKNFESTKWSGRCDVYTKKVVFNQFDNYSSRMFDMCSILSHIWNTTLDMKCQEMQKSKSDKKILAYINEYSEHLAKSWFQL